MAEGSGDSLFGGLTRPATILGLPIEALLLIVGGTAVVYLVISMFQVALIWRLLALGVGGVLYGIARLLCMKDPRAFRYLALMLETKGGHRTRAHWKSGSYSPLPHRIRR